ncbi:MAG: hypothetical protein WCO52_05375 [bacterium]
MKNLEKMQSAVKNYLRTVFRSSGLDLDEVQEGCRMEALTSVDDGGDVTRRAAWPANYNVPLSESQEGEVESLRQMAAQVAAEAMKPVREWKENHSRPIPAAQLQRAVVLAGAYGHEWGSRELLKEELGWDNPPAITAAEIQERVATARGDSQFSGISYPSMTGPGEIVHTTGSGRLLWTVHPTGDVDFEVCRPGNEIVLTAKVFKKEGEYWDTVVVEATGKFFIRHLEALFEAISKCAYHGGQQAFSACGPLWARAESEEVAQFDLLEEEKILLRGVSRVEVREYISAHYTPEQAPLGEGFERALDAVIRGEYQGTCVGSCPTLWVHLSEVEDAPVGTRRIRREVDDEPSALALALEEAMDRKRK